MNILDKIVEQKKIEVAERKKIISVGKLSDQAFYDRSCLSLCDRLKNSHTGIIAEFKRKSPSKGFINQFADAAEITTGYTKFGAAALSVLTDEMFFGGSTNDLVAARKNDIPILRKDFIIDEYQITEAKAMGADVVLLIAACLTKLQVQDLSAFAQETGMEVLLEIHDETELGHICDTVNIVGINNRNLKTFSVDVNLSLQLGSMIPQNIIKIAESGIDDPQTVKRFKNAGFEGFLIGEAFMKSTDPIAAFEQFAIKIKNL
jgi:indole-3-glycerol phosphate synthase